MEKAQGLKDGADSAALRADLSGADGDRVLDQIADTTLALSQAQEQKAASDRTVQEAAARIAATYG